MGTAHRHCSSVDEQIVAYIDAAKIRDKNAKLEDFQLRVVAEDLVLFNLITGQSFPIYDEENDLPRYPATTSELQKNPEFQERSSTPSITELKARRAASVAVRSGSRLFNLFAQREPIASAPPRPIFR